MTRSRTSVAIFVTCGLWLIALGFYFALLRPALLPEDLRYMGGGTGLDQLSLAGLERWLHRVFIVMGGFIAASGILTMFVALSTVGARRKGTGIVLAVAGLATVATMSWTNFVIGSQFRWLLLAPAVLWCAGIAAYAVEGRE